MSKAPKLGVQASPSPAGKRAPVMAYAGNAEAVGMVADAISRLELRRDELAKILRVPEKALFSGNIAADPEVARRLKDMLAIVTRLSQWTKDDRASLVWYTHEAIPAFGKTASEVVADGHGSAVLDYLDMLAVGGFA